MCYVMYTILFKQKLTVIDVKAFDKIPQVIFPFSANGYTVISSKEFIPQNKELNKPEHMPLRSRAFTFLAGHK